MMASLYCNLLTDFHGEFFDFLLNKIAVDEKANIFAEFDPENLPTDGWEFENWVAEKLSKYGWNARSTQGSGDQGVDVIAEKNKKTVGIQCKLYTGTVGNKAVQEILAGKTHFNLDFAVVITNSAYTKSAKELAKTSNVFLLSVHDIPDLEQIIMDSGF